MGGTWADRACLDDRPQRSTLRHKAAQDLFVLLRVFVPLWFCFLILNFAYLYGAEITEQSSRRVQIKLRIARINAQKKSTAAGLIKTWNVEHRVIRLRQAVECQHPEHSREGGQQYRALESHRYECRPTVQGPPTDVERINSRGNPVAKQEAAKASD